MKVAIIGCGTIANTHHIRAYLANPKTEIKYFCDKTLARAEKAVREYGCGIAVADYHEVLNDKEVEAVSVCVHNNNHARITIDALNAGKNVLCEKPASFSFEEVQKMQKAQHDTGKVLNIGVVNRFNSCVNKIKDFIEEGRLGEVYSVYVSFRSHRSIPGLGGDFTNSQVAGGGVTIDWGVHFFDIVMFCCGDPKVKSVSAETFNKMGNPIEDYVFTDMWAGPPKPNGVCDVEDGVTGLIRTEGPVITFNGAWAQNIGEQEMYIDFMGTKGGIRLQYGGNFVFYSTEDGMLTKTEYQMPADDMFINEINAFIECVETGKKASSHIDTNIITAEMMSAIYRSAKQHREISFD